MSDPFIGEIRMFGGNFAPQGWAFCNGAILSITENDALFSLIGTTYGGDGQNTFALPNLQSRVPMHVGNGHTLGEMGGSETVTLTTNQLAAHSHSALADSASGSSTDPNGTTWAQSTASKQYLPAASINASLNPAAVASAGGGQPHDNMLPFLAVNFIISLFGIYPSQS